MRHGSTTHRTAPARATRAAIAAVIACAAAGPTLAAQIRVAIERQVIYDNQPVALQVEVVNPDAGTGRPQLPPVDGLTIQGPSTPSHITSIVNGVSSTSQRYTFRITPTPERLGTFTVGPIRVPVAGGQPLVSEPITLTVSERPDSGVVFLAEPKVKTARLGVPFRVVYSILYSGDVYEGSDGFGLISRARYPFGLASLDLPILSRAGVRVTSVPVNPRHEAARLSVGDTTLLLQAGTTNYQGKAYRARQFALEITPTDPGTLDLGNATVAMMLEQGTRVVQDAFGRTRRVADQAKFTAATGPVVVQVQPLPTHGQPELFAGAIGRFTIDVRATDTEVDAFAPIELTVTITGEGMMDRLALPDWHRFEPLTRDFEVATDVDAGQTTGNTKTFHQVIRPRSEAVTEIPALPLPYFDPQLDAYAITRSTPIAITVRPVDTVAANDAIARQPVAVPTPSTTTTPTITVTPLGVGANFDHIGTVLPSLRLSHQLATAPFLAAMLAGPALFVLVWTRRRLARRDPQRRRSRDALANARRALSAKNATPEQSATAFTQYIRDRLCLPSGELTPRDLAALLNERLADAETTSRAVAVLTDLQASRFGGDPDPHQLARRSVEAMEELDRCLR